jgi:hypothetical protein
LQRVYKAEVGGFAFNQSRSWRFWLDVRYGSALYRW